MTSRMSEEGVIGRQHAEDHRNAFDNIKEIILEMREGIEEKHMKLQQEINNQNERINQMFEKLEEISRAIAKPSQLLARNDEHATIEVEDIRKSANSEEPEENLLDIPEEDELEKYGYYDQSTKSSPAVFDEELEKYGFHERSTKSSLDEFDDDLEKYGYYNRSMKSSPAASNDDLEKYGYYNESTKSSLDASDYELSMKQSICPVSQKRIELEQRSVTIKSYLKTMANVPKRRLNRIDQMRPKDKHLVCSFCLARGLHYSDSCPSYASVKSRKKRVRCELCLDSRHDTRKCWNELKRCRYCGTKDHDKALCILPEEINDRYRELDEIRKELERFEEVYGPESHESS